MLICPFPRKSSKKLAHGRIYFFLSDMPALFMMSKTQTNKYKMLALMDVIFTTCS